MAHKRLCKLPIISFPAYFLRLYNNNLRRKEGQIELKISNIILPTLTMDMTSQYISTRNTGVLTASVYSRAGFCFVLFLFVLFCLLLLLMLLLFVLLFVCLFDFFVCFVLFLFCFVLFCFLFCFVFCFCFLLFFREVTTVRAFRPLLA